MWLQKTYRGGELRLQKLPHCSFELVEIAQLQCNNLSLVSWCNMLLLAFLAGGQRCTKAVQVLSQRNRAQETHQVDPSSQPIRLKLSTGPVRIWRVKAWLLASCSHHQEDAKLAKVRRSQAGKGSTSRYSSTCWLRRVLEATKQLDKTRNGLVPRRSPGESLMSGYSALTGRTCRLLPKLPAAVARDRKAEQVLSMSSLSPRKVMPHHQSAEVRKLVEGFCPQHEGFRLQGCNYYPAMILYNFNALIRS